ncbi:MAG: RNase adapter RapZ, partial [Micrococcales bacterium]|nr:RNase adapter RapZ [Micrococcales bacterium]
MSAEPPVTTIPNGIPIVDANAAGPTLDQPQVIVITGMSGAGRTRAATALEDLGWYVVDNLPAQMLVPLVGMLTSGNASAKAQRLGAVIDVRGGEFFGYVDHALDEVEASGVALRMVFLDASDQTLVRRFEQVRRPHPLQGELRLLDAIGEERRLLAELRDRADIVIDTSELAPADLARQVSRLARGNGPELLRISIVAFGFKYGLPVDADHVVDVRFLANPYWITELRHLSGRDAPVRDYVLGLPGAELFLDRYVAMLEPVVEGYQREGKHYVTIAVGCTGGKHRSVAIAEALAARLRGEGRHVSVATRDLGK